MAQKHAVADERQNQGDLRVALCLGDGESEGVDDVVEGWNGQCWVVKQDLAAWDVSAKCHDVDSELKRGASAGTKTHLIQGASKARQLPGKRSVGVSLAEASERQAPGGAATGSGGER